MFYYGIMSTGPRISLANRNWGTNTDGCTILHVDMDAFYASLEIARRPALRGKPVIIGTGNRAVVSAASYEARTFGVNSAMPVVKARQLCPQGVFLPVDMPYYRTISNTIFHEILSRITDQIEQVSVDECYINVRPALLTWQSPIVIARWIRAEVERRFHITCSVGIASNKLIAKMASTNAKPNGMLLIPAAYNAELVCLMPLRAIPGIGSSLCNRLAEWGIVNVPQLRSLDIDTLKRISHSTVAAHMLYQTARGIDERPVVAQTPEKSIGTERTLPADTTDVTTVEHLLRYCCKEIAHSLRQRKLMARTITLKLRFSDLHYVTRSHTLLNATDSAHAMYAASLELLKSANPIIDDFTKPRHIDSLQATNKQATHEADARQHNAQYDSERVRLLTPVRLAGVTASNLMTQSTSYSQPSLDDILEEHERETTVNHGNATNTATSTKNERIRRVEHMLDQVREKYGDDAVSLGTC